MVATVDHILGLGIYTPAEAAFYARVMTQTMNRWIYGDKRGDRVIDPQIRNPDEKVVTFLDFVQSLAIREIRGRHKVPLDKIRDAVVLARERNIQYPFAVQHTAFLFSDGESKGHGEIVLDINGQMIQASGDARKNIIIKDVAQLYLKDLKFSPETGLAEEYVAWTDIEGRQIVMNPKIRFGEPIVKDVGYTAQSLWEAYEIEGGIEAAANAYGVENAYIELSLRYHDHLLTVSAA